MKCVFYLSVNGESIRFANQDGGTWVVEMWEEKTYFSFPLKFINSDSAKFSSVHALTPRDSNYLL